MRGIARTSFPFVVLGDCHQSIARASLIYSCLLIDPVFRNPFDPNFVFIFSLWSPSQPCLVPASTSCNIDRHRGRAPKAPPRHLDMICYPIPVSSHCPLNKQTVIDIRSATTNQDPLLSLPNLSRTSTRAKHPTPHRFISHQLARPRYGVGKLLTYPASKSSPNTVRRGEARSGSQDRVGSWSITKNKSPRRPGQEIAPTQDDSPTQGSGPAQVSAGVNKKNSYRKLGGLVLSPRPRPKT